MAPFSIFINPTHSTAPNPLVRGQKEHSMKTNRINEIVTETLRKGGIEKFPTTAMDWLVHDIETKLEADAVKRIHKFMTPALIARAISQSYSKRAARSSEGDAPAKTAALALNPPSPAVGN